MQAEVSIGGRPITLVVGDAVGYTAGDLAGNIDVSVTVTPVSENPDVVKNLRLAIPGDKDVLEPVGSEEEAAGVALKFHSPTLIGVGCVPPLLEVLWAAGSAPLGTIRCFTG